MRKVRSNSLLMVFAIILCFILAINCIKGLSSNISNNTLSFESFLTYLSNAPAVVPNFSVSDFSITGDWGWFDFFRRFLNIFTGIFGVSCFLADYIMRVLNYFFYFIKFLFV